jgi:hypothetical protein
MSKTLNIYSLIRYNLKLLNRIWSMIIQIIFLVAVLYLLLVFGEFRYNNITIMIVVLLSLMLTIPLSKNMFWGMNNEILLYYVTPTRINDIILAKNITLIIIITLYYSIISLALIINGVDKQGMRYIVLLFPILIFTYPQLLNYQSVLSHRYKIFNNPLISTIFTWIFIIAFCIPFFILLILFELYSIFIIYNVTVIVLWYFIAIPYTTIYFEINKYNILDIEHGN